jgi:hypothetical protein
MEFRIIEMQNMGSKNIIMLIVFTLAVISMHGNVYADVFFQDGFESGDLNHNANGARWTVSNSGAVDDVHVSSELVRSGNHALKFHYAGGSSSDDAWAEQRFALGGDKTDIFIRFYIYFPANFEIRNVSPSNNKAIVVWGDDYSSKGAQGQEFSANYFMPKAHKVWREGAWDVSCNGAFGDIQSVDGIGAWPTSSLPIGEWICFEYHFKADSGAGDGAMEFWVNGDKKYGATGIDWIGAPCSPGYFNAGYLLGWANSGYDEDTDIFIDDVVFSSTYIGPADTQDDQQPSDDDSSPQAEAPPPPENLRVVR